MDILTMQQAKTTPVDMALLAVAEQILRLNGYEVEAGAVARIVDDVGRLRAECEQLRQVLRQTLLTYVVADDAYDREASADRAMWYVVEKVAGERRERICND